MPLVADSTAASPLDVILRVVIVVALSVLVWALLTFSIRIVARRIAKSTSLSRRKGLRWAAPALQALDSERRAQRARTIGALLNNVVTVTISIVMVIYVLQEIGVNVIPILTSVGLLGVILGFGSQQLIRDYIAGIFISIEDQYGIGDRIVTSEVEGVVQTVGLRVTKVVADDGTIWYLRNGEIMRLGNRSQGDYVAPDETPASEDSDPESK